MACSGCSTDGSVPKGCNSNGSCGTGSCGKLKVFDWLANMELPHGKKMFDWVEVAFKNGRKDFYHNHAELSLKAGDVVAVESSPGHDIGVVTLVGELVQVQMRKKRVEAIPEQGRKVYRLATQRDIDRWAEARARETETMYKSREIAKQQNLDMKISDVEYQGDGSKALFFYTAETRIDFRQLIKDLAGTFGVRVEMRQIGARQEAARIGGIGSCGRELCCSTWLTDFRSVNTSAARYQQLSLNPQKLAGQCGKLKCCLNYELDSYLDAIKDFPDLGLKLKTDKGIAVAQKQDIFKRMMWFSYDDAPMAWVPISVDRVKEIIELNKSGVSPTLIDETAELVAVEAVAYGNVVGQDSLTRFDSKGGANKRRKKRNKPFNKNDRRPNT
jgi:cell fate regulator YaaT (PSP1 superfamily)